MNENLPKEKGKFCVTTEGKSQHRDMKILGKRTPSTESSRYQKYPADVRKLQKRLDLFGSSRFGLLPLREKRRYVMDPENGVTKRLDFRPQKNERGPKSGNTEGSVLCVP